MLLQPFGRLRLSLLIQSGKWSFLHTKTVYLPIMKKIFLKITRHQSTNGDKPNINTAFKVASEGLICIGKITFITVQRATLSIKDTQVTRVDISFSEFHQFLSLKLKLARPTSTTLGYSQSLRKHTSKIAQ